MKIVVTLGDIIDKGQRTEYCNDTGMYERAINEGLANSSDKVELTEAEAIRYGFLLSKE